MNLFISPITDEILEAAYITKCNLIPSCSQVGPNGYAFTDETFLMRRHMLQQKYKFKPYVERDHLGKGGENIFEWLERDKWMQFDGAMLHTTDRELVAEVASTFQSMTWQIGGGEDATKVWQPDWGVPTGTRWVSAPTGCLINGIGNKGQFDRSVPASYPYPFRAHNCDYLKPAQLRYISRYVAGLNIAPQIGTIQSSVYQLLGVVYGYPISEWLDACNNDKKNQARWIEPLACGHYHYELLEWRDDVYDIVLDYLVKAIRCLKGE